MVGGGTDLVLQPSYGLSCGFLGGCDAVPVHAAGHLGCGAADLPVLLQGVDGDLLHRGHEPCRLGLGGRGGGEVAHVLAQQPHLVSQIGNQLGGGFGSSAHAVPAFASSSASSPAISF